MLLFLLNMIVKMRCKEGSMADQDERKKILDGSSDLA